MSDLLSAHPTILQRNAHALRVCSRSLFESNAAYASELVPSWSGHADSATADVSAARQQTPDLALRSLHADETQVQRSEGPAKQPTSPSAQRSAAGSSAGGVQGRAKAPGELTAHPRTQTPALDDLRRALRSEEEQRMNRDARLRNLSAPLRDAPKVQVCLALVTLLYFPEFYSPACARRFWY